MFLEEIQNNHTGLLIKYYNNDNIYPLLPLLSQEFPNWTLDKIKDYVKIVMMSYLVFIFFFY